MKKEWIDTDRILDKCECGGFVKLLCDTEHQPNSWKAHCVECDNTTEWEFCQSRVMTAWNGMMRSVSRR